MNGGDDVRHLFFLDGSGEPITLADHRVQEYRILETRVRVVWNGPFPVTEFRHLVEPIHG